MGYTFISYSRKQLYFAEAVALNLQRFDVETWFDLQQLTIGADWRSSLEVGYKNCERLILIASQAALASPYVEVEWRTALENGREIILVIAENIEIPDLLKNFPVFDFRTRFDTRILQLADYIAGTGAPRHDEIPRPGKFPFPLHLPVAIWMAIAAQIMPFLWVFLLSLLSFSADNFVFLVGSLVGAAIMFVLFTRRFWDHELNYQTLRNISWGALLIQMIAINVVPSGSLEGSLLGLILLLAALITLNNLIFALGILNFSGSLLRWFAAGQVTQRFRLRVHRKLLQRKSPGLRDDTLPEPTPVPYYLLHDPADQPIAQGLSKILDKAGHTRVFDYEQAKTQLMIVTNYTSQKMIQWAGERFSGSALYLLGSPVNSIENIGSASNIQWVDIRENDRKIMEILARGLSNLAAWRREYALTASPKKFEAFHVPISIETYRYLGYLETGGLFANGLASMYLGNLYGSILGAVAGIVLLLLMDRFSTRRLSGIGTFLAVPGIPFFYLILQFNVLMFLAGLIVWMPRLIVEILAFIIGYRWLPFQSKPAKDMLGMDYDRKIRRWGYIMIIGFFVISTLLSFGLSLLISSGGR
jgi:hypothetical protein